MRKIVSLFLAIVLAAGALLAAPIQLPSLVVSANAEETTVPEGTTGAPEDTTVPGEDEESPVPEYELKFTLLNNNSEYSVSGYTGTPVDVVIPSEHKGKPVTAIADRAFESCTTLEAIEFSNTITRIGSRSFAGCTTLKALTIPGSVKEIDSYAFGDCSNLKAIVFLDGANGVNSTAFVGCTEIEKIDLPNTHVNLLASYFKGTKIYNDRNNWYGSSFYIDNQLINTTWYINGARTVRAGTTHLNPGAFAGTQNLIAVTIPASVKYIGDDVFNNSSISVIYYEGTESQFKQIDIGNNATRFEQMAIVCGVNKNNIPKTPKIKSVSNVSGGLQISWNKVANADLYAVYRRGSGTSIWTLLGVTTETAVIDTSAGHRQYWRYSVQAINDDGVSNFDSNGKYLKYVATPKLTGLYNKANGIELTWNAVSGASGYRVYRRVAGGNWQYITTVKGTAYLDKAVKNNNGKYYRYTVRAVVDRIYSGYEDYLFTMRLSTPQLVSAKCTDDFQFILKWKSVPSASGYYIYGYDAIRRTWSSIAYVKGGKSTTYKTSAGNIRYYTKFTVVAANGKYRSEMNKTGIEA